MSIKNQLKRTVYQLLKKDGRGSFATRQDRRTLMLGFVKDLVDLGYKIDNIYQLKPKHVRAVVSHWQQKKLTAATLKNRLSALRKTVLLLGKPVFIPDNKTLNIDARRYIVTKNRALHHPDFEKITHPHLRASLELQRLFGLRREESLKIKPHLADKINRLELQPSWCKGGRGRSIPILTEEQRQWLNKAKEVAGKSGRSLIPKGKNYVQHRHLYDKHAIRSGLKKLHGLRHAYAQRRYKELTGWDAPVNGGPALKILTPEQKEVDRHARTVLAEELGHGRRGIVANYCG